MSQSEPQGENSGQKDQKETSKAEAERKAFHRQQLKNPAILMPDLDPDMPVQLGKLELFDELICTRLRMLGYPGTGKADRKPQSCRPMTLARKLARGSPDISRDDINILADRIAWLQRNPFRWSVRNGYAEYFAKRGARTASGRSETKTEIASSDSGLAAERNAYGKDHESSREPEAAASEDVFDRIKKLDQQVPAGPVNSASQGLISDADSERVHTSGGAEIDLASAASGGGSEWSTWAAEVRRRIPEDVPRTPNRPRTFAKAFPIPKAKELLLAVVMEEPIAEQMRLAHDLLDDRSELYAALTHGEQAREDLLNVLACLGLELR
ncbi:MAG: hypothetical protein V2I43_11835 [Parvularcula sp.]|jgi:hypothetical protein|nr:hypothetical protein [Parvularcula sp.]